MIYRLNFFNILLCILRFFQVKSTLLPRCVCLSLRSAVGARFFLDCLGFLLVFSVVERGDVADKVPVLQFYEFQPSLAIVTRTLVIAVPDLLHFVAIFITFLVRTASSSVPRAPSRHRHRQLVAANTFLVPSASSGASPPPRGMRELRSRYGCLRDAGGGGGFSCLSCDGLARGASLALCNK